VWLEVRRQRTLPEAHEHTHRHFYELRRRVSAARESTRRAAPGADTGPSARVWFQLAVVAAEVGLIALLLRRYGLESGGVRTLVAVCAVAFPIHFALPAAWRTPAFATLSLASLPLSFGFAPGHWDGAFALRSTAWLCGAGVALIALCHLPISFAARSALFVAVGCGLAWLRAAGGETGIPASVWPVLGSMFMFRLLIYSYDLAHEKSPPRASRSLAYFFMLPNVVFPLFPVVDYKTFARCEAPPARRIAVLQTGAGWMLRGVIQLIAYRLVERHLIPDPSSALNGADVVRFLACNSLFYLRVSGQFHLAIGMLHLFGFDLPETNRSYFLAASFTDYWRRVNIYWKDFILKLFYRPAYFRVRHLNAGTALVLATFYTFAATWLLHSYQWFWLRGDFPLTWQDSAFWGVLAICVAANSLFEHYRGRERSLSKVAFSLAGALALGARTAATALSVSVLWSIWAAESLDQWLGLWRALDASALPALLLVLGVIAIAAVLSERRDAARRARRDDATASWLPRGALASLTLAVALYGAAFSRLHSAAPPELTPYFEALVGSEVRDPAGQAGDHGYYEALMEVGDFDPRRFAGAAAQGPDIARASGDFRLVELVPSQHTGYQGVEMSANRFGMRDRERELAKPPGVFRIALLGSSHAMGFGISDDDVFSRQLERWATDTRPLGPEVPIEILNFAVNGYSPLAQLPLLDASVPRFSPDLAILVLHSVDAYWSVDHLVRAQRAGIEIPYAYPRELVQALGISHRTLSIVARSRLRRHGDELLAWSYREIAARMRAIGAEPAALFLPLPNDLTPRARIDAILELARASGFEVIDLSEIYAGLPLAEIALASWNFHPSLRAHGMIAHALEREIFGAPRDLAQRAYSK
jgi:hypothetical protein